MRTLPVLLLRFIIELALLPVRLLLGLIGATAILFGALGTIAWPIQMLIGGRSGAPLPPAVMWLLSAAAIPAGLLLLTLAHAGANTQPSTPAIVGGLDTPDLDSPLVSVSAERTTTFAPELHTTVRILLAEPQQMRQRRASRQATRHRHKRRPL